MAKREILAGATDQTIDIFVPDSSSTVGAGLTGLVFNTAGLTCYYRKGATGTPTALTLATQTVGGAHSDGGFVAVDGTNCPGQYRLDLSDTIVATAGMVTLYLRGATNMAPVLVEIEVVSVNKFDAVRMGLTALPNANAEAAGGLYTRGTGAGQINQAANGQIDANAVALSGDSAAADNAESFFDGTGYAGTNNVIPTVTTTTTATNVTTVNGLAAGVITATSIAADAITAAKIADGAIDAATFAAGAINAAAIAADAITDAKVAADVTIASVTGSVGSVTGAVGSVTGNVGGNVTGSVGSVAAGGITASSIADGAIDRATFAADTGLQTIRSNTAQAGAAGTITLDASASATDDFYNDTTILLTGGTGVGQIRRIRDYVGSTKVATIVPNWATNPDATSTFAILPVTSAWDETLADHLDSGSTGAALNAAGAAGDPWSTALPGAYGAGTAGKIVGDNINATISSRATQTSVDTIDDFLDTEIAAIKTVTDSIGATGTGLTAIPWNAAWDAEVQSEANDALVAFFTSAETLVDLIWDEGLVNHVIAFSAGKLLYGSGSIATQTGTVNDVAATTTSFVTDLTSAVNDFYNDQTIVFTSGALIGQSKVVLDYNGATKAITLDEALTSAPANGVSFTLHATHTHPVTQIGGAVWDIATSGHTTSGTFGEQCKTDIDAILDDTGTAGVVVAAGSKTGYGLVSTGLDLVLVDGKTLPAALQYIAASTAGKISGAGTGMEVAKGLDGTTTRLTITVDASGNRSAITYG